MWVDDENHNREMKKFYEERRKTPGFMSTKKNYEVFDFVPKYPYNYILLDEPVIRK
jgi:hypothetical protein